MRALPLALALASLPALAAPRQDAISDDYRRALADARARNVPLLVDVWAPW